MRFLKGCLSCRHASRPRDNTGPDGYKTLCTYCNRRYSAHILPLFQLPNGRITALPQGEPVAVVGFGKKRYRRGESRDLTRPIVRKSSLAEHARFRLQGPAKWETIAQLEERENVGPISFPRETTSKEMRDEASPRSVTNSLDQEQPSGFDRDERRVRRAREHLEMNMQMKRTGTTKSQYRSPTPDRINTHFNQLDASSQEGRLLRRKRILEVLSAEEDEDPQSPRRANLASLNGLDNTRTAMQYSKRARTSVRRAATAILPATTTKRRASLNKDSGVHDRGTRIIETNEEKSFAVKIRSCYGWSLQTRCMFVAYNIKFKLFKELIRGAFGLLVDFEIRYQDDEGDEVSIGSDIEMKPLFVSARKLQEPLLISLYPPEVA